MKTIIKLFLILAALTAGIKAQSLDTAVWSLQQNQTNGKYSLIQNRDTYLGLGAGEVKLPLTFDIGAVDTSKFIFIPNNTNGKYSFAENKTTWYGKDSGTVRVNLSYDVDITTGTGTESSDVVTINAQACQITLSAGEGSSLSDVTLNNTFVNGNSIIFLTCLGAFLSDFYLSELSEGSVKINWTGNSDGQIINVLIINP